MSTEIKEYIESIAAVDLKLRISNLVTLVEANPTLANEKSYNFIQSLKGFIKTQSFRTLTPKQMKWFSNIEKDYVPKMNTPQFVKRLEMLCDPSVNKGPIQNISDVEYNLILEYRKTTNRRKGCKDGYKKHPKLQEKVLSLDSFR